MSCQNGKLTEMFLVPAVTHAISCSSPRFQLMTSRIALFAIRTSLCVICLLLAAIGLLRHFWLSHVGLFVFADHRFAFGILSDTAGGADLMGAFVTPVCLGCAALLYLALGNPSRTA